MYRRLACGAAALLFGAVALRPALAARPRIVMDGHPEMDMPPNDPTLVVPDWIRRFTDDTLHPAMEQNDVVVIYLRENHCTDCDFYARYYYAAAEKLRDVPGVAVGQIDIHDEGEIFEQWHGVEEDIPALLVFKSEDTLRFRRKPVHFVVNSRIATDLPPFVHRLLGPSPRPIADPQEWADFLEQGQNHSDGLVVGLWRPPGLPRRAARLADTLFQRLAELERYNLLFGLVSPSKHADYDALAAGRNPLLAENVPVVVTYETGFSPPRMDYYRFDIKRDFKEEMRAVREWLEGQKTKRVGHKYDRMVNFHQEDVSVPDNCSESRKVEQKNYVHLHMLGRSSATGVVVLDHTTEFVTGENQHMKGVDRGVIGMCAGMKRLLVLPLQWRSPIPAKEKDKFNIHNNSNLLLEVHLWEVNDSNKMPGRIEWEKDPEKIAEHQRKVKEQEAEREAAIARGEDPDAQCKAEKAAEEATKEEKPKKTVKRRLKVIHDADGNEQVVEVDSSAGAGSAGGTPSDEDSTE
eukprot:TRINITY_DN20641_c0_g1_i1.p1 TRINITY_DN20641_c0_g1~~TRINITY_DN20641_c0_g1_i1.p1  ORF type:complete len:549 (+),score=197.76 TRINITY_DN20641_c0_g1_i1:90-1649(+)